MFESITVQRFSVGSIYKLLAIGSGCSLIPFCILMGCFALFGAGTVNWNGQSLTGIDGLVAALFTGVFLAALITGFFGTMLAIGLWLYSRFRPLKLSVISIDSEPA